jgi:hypothetical protein
MFNNSLQLIKASRDKNAGPNRIFREQDIWFRTGTSGGLLWTRSWTSEFHKRRVILWPAEQLLAITGVPFTVFTGTEHGVVFDGNRSHSGNTNNVQAQRVSSTFRTALPARHQIMTLRSHVSLPAYIGDLWFWVHLKPTNPSIRRHVCLCYTETPIFSTNVNYAEPSVSAKESYINIQFVPHRKHTTSTL